ncbi:MAG: lipopolysaccharide biosynthesis protein [Saprospirales bacterium]|jgi:O-antigen/teichoic acid export membrane protein|nr:lipopolysaccharide biosynthesis protein [Saprospirales bacterium]MBK7334846.1 lipopolysaccharide biosynthesis protein [Saprospirales bacterium]
MSQTLGERSLAGILWVFIDKLGSSSVNFIITIVLARLLAPEDFGLVAMVMVFFELSSVFVESGFSTALIREKEISEVDKSTTFIFNLVVAIVLYVALFFCAPMIAAFFDQPALVWITRVMGLNLIVEATAIIPSSTLMHRIDFKTQTKARFGAVLISGIAGVLMALGGLGVWALVLRIGVMALIQTFFLWRLNPWKPTLVFSKASFRRLFGFGSNILMAAILDKFFVHIYKVVIGKFFSAASLGFYMQAANFSNMVINTLFRTVQSVTYPVLSKLQDDLLKLKDGYRKILKLSSFVIFPAMTLLGVMAEPAILALVGEKWLPSVPFLQLLCLSGATYHLTTVNLNMLLVLGRSDLSLRLEVIKKIIIGISIVVGLQYGIFGLVIGEVISTYINLMINTYYSKKFLNYSVVEQFRDILPTILISLATGAAVYFVSSFPGGAPVVHLILGSICGGLLYLGLHLAARTQEMEIIRRMVIPKTIQLIAKLR